jgi:hypothetical protein
VKAQIVYYVDGPSIHPVSKVIMNSIDSEALDKPRNPEKTLSLYGKLTGFREYISLIYE